MEKKELDEILEKHVMWLNKNGGERAVLRKADLRGAGLSDTILREANLREAVLRRADLRGANLEGANLREVNLEGADLEGANLKGAKLEGASLEGAILPTGIYQIVGAGSFNRCTTYDSINDRVICGCWDDGAGNHLDSFEKRIEEIYGAEGEEPNLEYHKEYMAVVAFFKAVK